MNKKNVIICRCEDVTLEDLHNLMEEGYTSFEEIKRILRVGMGPCQGNTCGQLVQREIAKFTNTPINEVPTQKVRPLSVGVKLKAIVKAIDNES
ncbi:MAG: (2Fe-2S)-binding protein [Candidatus Izimaplasma sp.]|nr:(2Fe-2S)-binding protein [Candidatus Izimaplasma bacterium]